MITYSHVLHVTMQNMQSIFSLCLLFLSWALLVPPMQQHLGGLAAYMMHKDFLWELRVVQALLDHFPAPVTCQRSGPVGLVQ